MKIEALLSTYHTRGFWEPSNIGTSMPRKIPRLPQERVCGNIRRKGLPLQAETPRGRTDPDPRLDGGDIVWDTGRGGDSIGNEINLHKMSGLAVRDSVGTPEGVAQRGGEGEVTHHKNMGDPGKYDTGGAPIGPPPRGNDLDRNYPDAEWREIFQRYRVGGGDV